MHHFKWPADKFPLCLQQMISKERRHHFNGASVWAGSVQSWLSRDVSLLPVASLHLVVMWTRCMKSCWAAFTRVCKDLHHETGVSARIKYLLDSSWTLKVAVSPLTVVYPVECSRCDISHLSEKGCTSTHNPLFSGGGIHTVPKSKLVFTFGDKKKTEWRIEK